MKKKFKIEAIIIMAKIAQTKFMLRKFIFYGMLGWIIEILWTGLKSLLHGRWTLDSHTYLWMFPIYGSAVMLEYVHEQIRPYKWWARGLIYMTLILSIEYFTGYFLDYLVGACPWDYTGNSLSVKGYIRLDYAPVWFGAGLLFEQIHDNVVKKWLR